MGQGRLSKQRPEVVMLVPDPDFEWVDTPDAVTARGEIYLPADESEPIDVAAHVRSAVRTINSRVDAAKNYKAPRGPRPGEVRQERRSGETMEIFQTCHVRPQVTDAILRAGRLPDQSGSGLDLMGRPIRLGSGEFMWASRLRTSILTRRAATLHISSTPSSNLTTVELVPTSNRAFAGGRFVRRGIRSVQEVAASIELLARSVVDSPPSVGSVR